VARQFRRLDAFALAGGAAIALVLAVPVQGLDVLLRLPLGEVLATALPAVLGLMAANRLLSAAKLYDFSASETLWSHAGRTAACLTASAAAAVAGAACLHGNLGLEIRAWAGAVVLASLSHSVAYLTVRHWRKTGRLTPTVIIVGANTTARRLIEGALAAGDAAVLGVFDDRETRVPRDIHGVPVLGGVKDLLAHRTLPFVDRIIIAVAPSAESRVAGLVARLKYLPNPVTLVMDAPEAELASRALKSLADAPLSQVSGVRENAARWEAKRMQDLILGGVFFALTLPLMALIALAIRLDGPGPILFRQRRHGFNSEVIEVWKFRTLRAETTDAHAHRQVTLSDPRVTRVGRILRRLSLDELPQLVNVIRGEMSLVGPRPHAIGMMTRGEDSARLVAGYAWRHRVKPGLTGWAQINGSIGPVDTPELVRRRVAFDVDYIERQSFWFDLRILLLTGPALMAARNVLR